MKKLAVSTIAIAVTLVLLTLALTLPAVAQAPGDANDDGYINAGDITKVERIIMGWDAETPGADANEDGTVNASDIGVIEYKVLDIWPWSHVHIEAPDNLPYCTHFTATVFVTYIEDFGSASYLIEFNDSVLELEGVTSGLLLQVGPKKTSRFYTVNATDWKDWGGAVVINNSVDGNPGVNGAGYLAKIHFHVIGSQGESTTVDFNTSSSGVYDRWGAAISATWEGDTVNVSAGGPEPTPTATATASATATPTATATSTATATLQPDLAGTEWWLWQIYYNGSGEVNTVYHIASVRAVDATANVTYDAVGEDDSKELTYATLPQRGFTNYSAPGAAIIDWSVDQSGTQTEPARERVYRTGLVGTFVPASQKATMMDAAIYTKGNDSTCWIDADQLQRNCAGNLADGDKPIDLLYSYGDANRPANSSAPPGAQDGYPFAVSDTWPQWEWTFIDGKYLIGDQQSEKGFDWTVNRTIASYNVAAACEAPAAGGVFDVTEVLRKNTYFRTYNVPGGGGNGANNSPDADYTRFYWNDSVKNYVRMLDLDTYYGREDWGIVDYETRDIGATITTFSDAGAGFDIGVRITNTAGAAANFSVLALVFDMDAVTDDAWSDGVA